MSVSTIRIPTYVNAVELAAFIMEKRKGERMRYTADSTPNLEEINDRLLASEGAVTKLMNTSWRPDRDTFETTWMRYARSSIGRTRSYYGNVYNKWVPPATIKLLKHPVISIDKLECIIQNEFVDLVASEDYTEGWGKDYYVDYRNGVIEFRKYKPHFRTPIRIEYTCGRLEHQDGYSIYEGSVSSDATYPPTETSISADFRSAAGKYDGKLIKITSGTAADSIYRIKTSTTIGEITTLTVLDGYTMVTDGVLVTDTFEVYSMPHDIQEMIKIYAYLGLLISDPTYQHNFTNPYEDPNPLWQQFEWLSVRFSMLLAQRQSTIQIVL